jgi:lipopolysaccharide export system protein LptA
LYRLGQTENKPSSDKLKYITYILILFFSINSYAQSSEKIELLNSDRLVNGPKNSDYWICSGNVSFKHNQTIMKCDSSHHYMRDNKMVAFGKIRINKGDSLFISGKKLFYDGNNNIAHLSGGVFLKDKHTKLTTEEIKFNLKDNIAHYPSEGKIKEKDLTLTSGKGTYNTKSHMFYFKKNVEVISSNYKVETDTLNYNSENKTTYFLGPSYIFSDNNTIYCENGWYNTSTNLSQFRENAYLTNGEQTVEGDSLFYNRNLGYGKAINNISLVDTSNNIIVNGNLSEYFEKEDKIEVTKQALLNILFEEDTLFMTANIFISYSSGKEYLLAYNNVKIFKNDFQGKCDSLYYSISDSIVNLYKSPVLWVDEMQITSDSIEIQMKDKKINKMNFYPNPLVVSLADSLFYNQIKGKFMSAFFTDNKLSKIDVLGNGQSLFVIEEDSKDKIGINRAICTDIFIKLKDGKLSHLTYKNIPNSTTTPITDIIESDKYLEGFIWRITEKPNSKKDILE